MRIPRLSHRLLWVCLALMTLFACGGGGGSASSRPAGDPVNMVTVTLPPPAASGGSYWVAFQDGLGPWKVLTGTPSGPNTTTFKSLVNDPTGRYGIVVVDVYPLGGGQNGYYGMLEHFTLSEVRTLDFSAWAPVAKASVSVALSGLSSADGARISTGDTTKTFNPGVIGGLMSANTGAADFVAARLPGMGPADVIAIRRAHPVPVTGPVQVAFDFITGWSLIPQTATMSNVAAPETPSFLVDWMMPSTSIRLAGGNGTTFAFNAVPVDRMLPGELHVLTARGTDPALPGYRQATAYSLSVANTDLPLPPALPLPTLGAANLGTYYRPALAWTNLPGAMVHDLAFGDVYEFLDWDVHLSAGWLGSGGTPSFTFPEFVGLSGWNSAWGLPFGRDLYWNLSERQTTHADSGFYFRGPRAFKAGNTAWECLNYGGLSVTPGKVPESRNAPLSSARPEKASGLQRRPQRRHGVVRTHLGSAEEGLLP